MFNRLFVDHPRTVDESYTQHWAVASSFGLRMIIAGIGTIIHGFVPGLLTHAGSDMIRKLHGEMTRRHSRATKVETKPLGRWQAEYEI
jgi:hypothetical protein